MSALELNDIQGIIRRGYGELEAACFLLLEVTDAHLARGWLGEIADQIRDGTAKPDGKDSCLNIAFTQAGFTKLGLEKELSENERFSIEFEDGMTTKHRGQILADHGESDPERWDWGGSETTPVHVLLLLYAGNQVALEDFYAVHHAKLQAGGLAEIRRLDALELPDRKEHFGFRDGIAQPRIAGLLDKEDDKTKGRSQKKLDQGGSDGNILAAGEFILGYPNVYSKIPASPKVKPASDGTGCLKDDGKGARDFGRNGSYLVFRQLRQNVREFWTYIDERTRNPDGSSNAEERDKLAAKMVGRWRSGAPLALAQDRDDPSLKNEDSFGYYRQDRFGDKCPVASHVRRTNPRDSLEPENKNPDVALKNANKHRIIRRGRPYGLPMAKSMDPEDVLKTEATDQEVGLQFLCFNANIGRQFEFIQHTWINNPKFAELYSEADPLLGDNHAKSVDRGIFGNFVAPGEPLRRRVSGLQRFVDVRGGAYFFMPGIGAIRYLAELRKPKEG